MAVLIGLSAAACSPKVETRGNLPRDYQLERIDVGTATKQEVVEVLGTPSTLGTFDDNIWYYISRRTEQWAFLPKEVTEQKVVVLYFDEKDVLQQIEQYNQDDIRNISLVERETPTAGHSITFIEQLFGNFGRFNR